MDQADLPIKPGIFVRGSISPAGANSSKESENCEQSRVVVWCAQWEKFLRPCTNEFLCLPVCVYANAPLPVRWADGPYSSLSARAGFVQ